MARRLHAFAALVLLAVTVPVAHADGPALRIAEILPNPDTTIGQREFIELWNSGATAVELAGFRIRDASSNNFTFPAWTLAAGGRVVVWGGGAADGFGPRWSNSAVWNNAGDTAILLNPQGAEVDRFEYGTGTEIAAPAKGSSLTLDGSTWKSAAPSPGQGPTGQGGSVEAEVPNVAPRVELLDVPSRVAPGETIAVRLRTLDDNGAADIASWRLTSGTAVLAAGNASTDSRLNLTAPTGRQDWTLTAFVQDRAGQNGTAQATLLVRGASLVVELAGPIRFPPLVPGSRNVTAPTSFTLRNDGDAVVRPLLDVSPFQGPATLAVDGNLWIGLGTGATTKWVLYNGPLTSLGDLAPGQAVQVQLRIAQVPIPLAAGSYGTSFAVVA